MNTKLNELIVELASVYPYSVIDIREVFTNCKRYYSPYKSVGKCRDIIDSAVDMKISLFESYTLQRAIDFDLLKQN